MDYTDTPLKSATGKELTDLSIPDSLRHTYKFVLAIFFVSRNLRQLTR